MKIVKDFDNQFESTETFNFIGGNVEVWDLVPKKVRPGSLPVVFLQGWGGTPRLYKEGLRRHFDVGRRVLAISLTLNASKAVRGNARNTLALKCEALLRTLEVKGIKRADVVAYSEGNSIAMLAATQNESAFRHFVLEAPPALTGKESHLRIALRGICNAIQGMKRSLRSEEEEKTILRKKREEVKEWMRSVGAIQGTLDAMRPGLLEFRELLRSLKEKNHGIIIIAAVDDCMISMTKLQKQSAARLGVVGFYSVAGSHAVFETNSRTYGHLAEHALKCMEKKYGNNN